MTVKDQMLDYYKRSREISLRDYFAGQAMVWLLTQYGMSQDLTAAYEIADQMLRAREGKASRDPQGHSTFEKS